AASALAFVGFVVGSSPLPKLKAIVLPGSGSKAKTPLSATAQELPSAVKKPQKASASGALAHEVSGTPSIAHSSFGSDWTFSISKPAACSALPAVFGSPSAQPALLEPSCSTRTATPSQLPDSAGAAWAGAARARPPVASRVVRPRRAMAVRTVGTTSLSRGPGAYPDAGARRARPVVRDGLW